MFCYAFVTLKYLSPGSCPSSGARMGKHEKSVACSSILPFMLCLTFSRISCFSACFNTPKAVNGNTPESSVKESCQPVQNVFLSVISLML